VALLLAVSAGCGRTAVLEVRAVALPERPLRCEEVAAGGGALASRVTAARGGEVLCLAPGLHEGPVVVSKTMTLWGPRSAVVRARVAGTTVDVRAPNVSLLGFTVDGSGGRYDRQDAAVRVVADDARLEGLLVVNAVFSVLTERCKRVVIRGNDIVGSNEGPQGMRGDNVRMWETYDSTVEGNRFEHGRDVVIWYSSRNRILHNRVRNARYGTHFMYSHENLVEDNRYLGNVVGIFVMYSRDVGIRRNLLAGSRGSGGIGLGVKESGNLTVEHNDFVLDHTGLYIDTSPLQLTDHNRFVRNTFRLNDLAVSFHSSQTRNEFLQNTFLDNQSQVQVAGGGDALGVRWHENHYDDYVGYDLDGDGHGDVPYQLRSLSGQLLGRYPNVAFFRSSPTLKLVDAASQFLPLLQPKLLVVDARPRMRPFAREEARRAH
jgi:nitrous oxidase accessory protein